MSRQSLFADRFEAGERLAAHLHHLASTDTVVVGLPRGGVPVAARVAAALGASLDVIVVRKLGAPRNPEYAIGAIGEGGVIDVDPAIVETLGITDDELAAVVARESDAVAVRLGRYRGRRAPHPLTGRTVVLVDDGIATGATMRAACRVARAQGATRIVVAVPCAPPGWEDDLDGLADELVALRTPEPYFAVNQWYLDFRQVTDDEVVALLEDASSRRAAATVPKDPPTPSGT